MLLPTTGAGEAEPGRALNCRPGSQPMVRLELVFGANSGRRIVGPRAWARFLATEVTPRFPEGLTVFEGTGQWRGHSRSISRERSRLLLIWYAPDAGADGKIETIRAAYKRRFGQDSVLRADGASCVSF